MGLAGVVCTPNGAAGVGGGVDAVSTTCCRLLLLWSGLKGLKSKSPGGGGVGVSAADGGVSVAGFGVPVGVIMRSAGSSGFRRRFLIGSCLSITGGWKVADGGVVVSIVGAGVGVVDGLV